jgi:hypothetical protein
MIPVKTDNITIPDNNNPRDTKVIALLAINSDTDTNAFHALSLFI